MELIDKSAVVAEINNWIQDASCRYTMSKIQFSLSDRIESLENLLSFLDNLEVKEVDFDKEFDKFHIGMYNPFDSRAEIREFAKHFFELGRGVNR